MGWIGQQDEVETSSSIDKHSDGGNMRKQTRSVATKRAESRTTSSETKQPRAMRPTVPASYRFPTSLEGLLDWTGHASG